MVSTADSGCVLFVFYFDKIPWDELTDRWQIELPENLQGTQLQTANFILFLWLIVENKYILFDRVYCVFLLIEYIEN